jgi:hypothetical protein
MGDYSKPLLDVRRMKNALKLDFKYECQILENPFEKDIRNAISESLNNMNWTNMNWSSREALLVIYFSGSATTS